MKRVEQVLEEIDENGNKLTEEVPCADGKKTKIVAKK